MTKTYPFNSKFGVVYTKRADMDSVNKSAELWEAIRPKPTPPTLTTKPSDLTWSQIQRARMMAHDLKISDTEAKQMIADEIGDREDINDTEYKQQLLNWKARKWLFTEQLLIKHYVLVPLVDGHNQEGTINGRLTTYEMEKRGIFHLADPTILNKILNDAGSEDDESERIKLHLHISRTSQLTYWAVLESARCFRYNEKGQTDLGGDPRRRRRDPRLDWLRLFCGLRGGRITTRLS